MLKKTLNLSGHIISLERPLLMAIVNVTPDSFYAGSRLSSEEERAVRLRLETIIQEGADLVDIGAYSSRPGAEAVSLEEERSRLSPILSLISRDYPECRVSVDTFRSEIARWAVGEFGVSMINDISGGTLDPQMFRSVAELQVPYILMHMRGNPQTMQSLTEYDNVGIEVLDYFIERSEELRAMGLHDLIIDPGFGFAKTLEQNYELMGYLPRFREALGYPLLVGISRKSMIYKALSTMPEESLNGTTVLHTYALLSGANILRVHDVREARETIELCQRLQRYCPEPENPVDLIIRPQNGQLTSNN